MTRREGGDPQAVTRISMGRTRIGLGALGVVLGLIGAYAFVTGVPGRQWLGVFTWLGGGVVAHDAVIAPAAALVGLVVLSRQPARFRAPMRVVALAVASVALIGVPLLMTR
ncbi:MAG: hypothetical protein ABI438_01315 [Dermatophilaceae bacterium]